jgi:hypothetical protein
MATTYAAAGKFDDAVTSAKQAVELAKATRQDKLAADIEKRIKLYEAGQKYIPK